MLRNLSQDLVEIHSILLPGGNRSRPTPLCSPCLSLPAPAPLFLPECLPSSFLSLSPVSFCWRDSTPPLLENDRRPPPPRRPFHLPSSPQHLPSLPRLFLLFFLDRPNTQKGESRKEMEWKKGRGGKPNAQKFIYLAPLLLPEQVRRTDTLLEKRELEGGE